MEVIIAKVLYGIFCLLFGGIFVVGGYLLATDNDGHIEDIPLAAVSGIGGTILSILMLAAVIAA